MMRVVAYFESLPQLERAAREARRAGWHTVDVCAPAYNETVLAVAYATRSPVGMAVLVGGVVGLLFGVLLTVGTVRQWPGLIVSGKPLISVPPFLIIVFELTILFASIGGALSFLIASALARRAAAAACDARTTDDRFSLLLESMEPQDIVNEEMLRRMDANEWRRI